MKTASKTNKEELVCIRKKQSYVYKNVKELNEILDKSEKNYQKGINKVFSFNRAYGKVIKNVE